MRILLLSLLPIGDTLFTTPAVHALRKRHPDAHITALVYPTNAGILRANPDIDNLLYWPTRQTWPGLTGVLRLFRTLRRSHFDLAVEFSSYNMWVTFLSGIPLRTDMQLPRFWWGLPGAGREWRKRHAVEHYTDVVRRLGIPVEDMALRIHPSAEDEKRVSSWLDRYEVRPDEMLVSIHPGGEGLWGRKQWGAANFAEVATGLYSHLGARVILMGGKEDAPLAAEIAARTVAHIINATGQTSLGETAALTKRCALFVGNDSSPLHIATASGTPVVGIYGPTDPRSYRPWIPGGEEGRDYALVHSYLPCAGRFPLVGGITLLACIPILFCPALTTITPHQVLKACLRLVGDEGRKTKDEGG
jgi:lipopolysaccharide heptosyltransferase II